MSAGGKVAAALGSAALLASAAGCSLRVGQFTVASTHKIPARHFREIAIVQGHDCTRMVMGIPLGPLLPRIDKAVANALQQAPEADSMIRLSVFRDERYYVFYQQTCFRVKGMAASTRDVQPSDADARNQGKAR